MICWLAASATARYRRAHNRKDHADASAIHWLGKVLSRDFSGEMTEHDMCGHELGAMVLRPASRVLLSDVFSSFSVEQQAWMCRWAGDLQGDDSVQFADT